MQNINQLTANVKNQVQNNTETCLMSNLPSVTDNQSKPSEQLTSLVAEMFVKWKRRFKNKIKNEDWGVDTIFDWAEILTELQITKSEFDKAERAVKLAGGWPPSHPADFLALGRIGQQGGYPDMRKAYEHAVDYSGRLFDDRSDWQNVVIYETARRIGFTKLAINPEKMTWHSWQQVYQQVCDEHKTGAEFALPIDKSKQLAYEHTPVQAGSETDKQITAKLAELRRLSA